ncbi:MULTISPECIES: GNAT family N-acetyltransferase [unclassified Paenibacillus]|nr:MULTISPECIES: GNAT family N-acetyltransferase [unclassified Paenibacillus]
MMELYRGYPGERDLYIGLFAVDPTHRGRRLGSELVYGILSLAAERSYETVRAAVGLKNGAALRFWIGCGSKEAVKVSGDREHGGMPLQESSWHAASGAKPRHDSTAAHPEGMAAVQP